MILVWKMECQKKSKFIVNTTVAAFHFATSYNINTIRIGLIWAKITYLKSAGILFFK